MKGLVVDLAFFVSVTVFFNGSYYYLHFLDYDSENRNRILNNLEGVRFVFSILFISCIYFVQYNSLEDEIIEKLRKIDKQIQDLQQHLQDIDLDLFGKDNLTVEHSEEDDTQNKVEEKVVESNQLMESNKNEQVVTNSEKVLSHEKMLIEQNLVSI